MSLGSWGRGERAAFSSARGRLKGQKAKKQDRSGWMHIPTHASNLDEEPSAGNSHLPRSGTDHNRNAPTAQIKARPGILSYFMGREGSTVSTAAAAFGRVKT
jgi:hypothetical protein